MIKITFHFPQSTGFRYVAYFFADEGVCCDQLVCVPFGPVIHNRHVPEIRRDVTNVAFFFIFEGFPNFFSVKNSNLRRLT